MDLLLKAARIEGWLLLSAIGGVTLWKVFQSVSFAGLIRASDGTPSPGRIQMLVVTVMTAMQYLLAATHDPSKLPDVPTSLVTAMGGSQLVYLGAKAWSIFGPDGKGRAE